MGGANQKSIDELRARLRGPLLVPGDSEYDASRAGVYGSGAWCYTTDHDEEYNDIVGSKGRIRFSTFTPVPIRVMRGESAARTARVLDAILDEFREGKRRAP